MHWKTPIDSYEATPHNMSMSKRKEVFIENQIYHIYNRGVEKRTIFLDNQDYLRATHNLYEFNDENPAVNLYYKQPILRSPLSYEATPHKNRKPIVEILAYALMPNHYHFLLRQLQYNGITDFMHKLGTGYAMYFNQRYQRNGSLFQGPFQAIRITKEAHFLHLPFYIHANPLDLKFPEWRERNLKDAEAAFDYLKKYRWSSLPDYIGIKNFPSVTERSFLTDFVGAPKKFESATFRLLKEMDVSAVNDIALEPI